MNEVFIKKQAMVSPGVDIIDRNVSSVEEAELLGDLLLKIKECRDSDIQAYAKHLPNDHLLALIRTRKFNAQRAFQTLADFVYSRSKKYPETYVNLYPSKCEKVLRCGGCGTLKAKDSSNRGIVYIRISEWDPDEATLEEVVLTMVLVGYECMNDRDIQINGVQILLDAKGFCFKQAKQLTPFAFKKYMDIMLNTSALKIKGIHVINTSVLVEKTWKLLKVCFPIKMRNRLFFHNSPETLQDHFPPEVLPEWLSGSVSNEDVTNKELINTILSPEREQWFRLLASTIKQV